MTDWSAAQYLAFANERTRPAADLLAHVPLDDVALAVDLGCGPGTSTELVVRRYPGATVIGVDTSPDMLRNARARLPGCDFVEADVATWTPDPATDLLFANALFQWVPDHLAVLERLLVALHEGGVLAVQMPDNLAEPSHRLMQAVADDGPWSSRLSSAARPPLPSVERYYDALRPHASRIDLWHTVYEHPLRGPDAIVEWLSSTGLRPYLEPLTATERAAFLATYTAAIAKAYPPRVDGMSLLRFPRLFLVAQRGAA